MAAAGGGLSAVASRRIQSELTEWTRSPPEGMCLESCDPITTWTIAMSGPEDAPVPLYRGETFRLRIVFGPRYPLEPPEVIFIPPHVPIHPHLYSNGHICADILYDGPNGAWSPALTISKLCLTLRSMLASNADKRRPPGDADYCRRVGARSPKLTQWRFDDDTV